MLTRIMTTALTLALVAAAPMRASAEDYKWPNNIPPEAKQLMEPLPLVADRSGRARVSERRAGRLRGRPETVR